MLQECTSVILAVESRLPSVSGASCSRHLAHHHFHFSVLYTVKGPREFYCICQGTDRPKHKSTQFCSLKRGCSAEVLSAGCYIPAKQMQWLNKTVWEAFQSSVMRFTCGGGFLNKVVNRIFLFNGTAALVVIPYGLGSNYPGLQVPRKQLCKTCAFLVAT